MSQRREELLERLVLLCRRVQARDRLEQGDGELGQGQSLVEMGREGPHLLREVVPTAAANLKVDYVT